MNIRNLVIAAVYACAGIAACAAVSPPAVSRPPAAYPLPESKKDCSTCHLPAGTGTSPALKNKLSALCLDCHMDRVAPSEHQVDIVPKMEVKGLPLTDGRITCFTCHDPHRNPHGGLLRKPETELCLSCHPY